MGEHNEWERIRASRTLDELLGAVRGYKGVFYRQTGPVNVDKFGVKSEPSRDISPDEMAEIVKVMAKDPEGAREHALKTLPDQIYRKLFGPMKIV